MNQLFCDENLQINSKNNKLKEKRGIYLTNCNYFIGVTLQVYLFFKSDSSK